MKVLITGIDGYLGWSLAQYLTLRGHYVAGIDGGYRRQWVEEMGSWSAVPIPSMQERQAAFQVHYGKPLPFWEGDLRDYAFVREAFAQFRPDAVIHLGECPSAPYSSIDVEHAVRVQTNNLTTTFHVLYAMKEITPDAHLIKLGTMGEYGTPDMDIPEGFFEVEYRGRSERLPFPRQAGSWYHWSKVHGSNNIMFACKLWNLKATDIMQGIVFGAGLDFMRENEQLQTRLDFDEAFGTLINRFVCQAIIGHPLTLYGSGRQQRGFIPLQDSMQCLALALEHPPEYGEYRVLNQFQAVYRLSDLAQTVQSIAARYGRHVDILHVNNPRMEREEHYFQPDHQKLFDLGYQPTTDVHEVLSQMFETLLPHADRIEAKRHRLLPHIQWRETNAPPYMPNQVLKNALVE